MEELELNRINANSPYIVELDFSTGLFKFVSDFGVSFSVAFEKDELLQSESHISLRWLIMKEPNLHEIPKLEKR